MTNIFSFFKKSRETCYQTNDCFFQNVVEIINGLKAELQCNLEKAIKEYKLTIRINPANNLARAKLGACYEKKHDYEAAIKQYKIAFNPTINAEDLKLNFAIAEKTITDIFKCAMKVAEKKKDPTILEELLLHDYSRISPRDDTIQAITHYNIGKIYACKNNYQAALANLNLAKECRNLALKSGEKDVLLDTGIVGDTHRLTALCNMHFKQTDNAISELHKALETIPCKENLKIIHEYLGMCYQTKGEYEKAQREKTIANEP